MKIPNIMDASVPIGKDDSENVENEKLWHYQLILVYDLEISFLYFLLLFLDFLLKILNLSYLSFLSVFTGYNLHQFMVLYCKLK